MQPNKLIEVLNLPVILILSSLRLCGSAVYDHTTQASSIIIVEDAKSKIII